MVEYSLCGDGGEKLELDEGVFEGWSHPPCKDTRRRILRDSYRAIIAVDTRTKTIIGFSTIMSDGVLSAYIPLLEVVSEYRSRGICRRLVERAIEETKDLYMLDLCCDEELASFYTTFSMLPMVGMERRNYARQDGATPMRDVETD